MSKVIPGIIGRRVCRNRHIVLAGVAVAVVVVRSLFRMGVRARMGLGAGGRVEVESGVKAE
jgi:hypothetical protein